MLVAAAMVLPLVYLVVRTLGADMDTWQLLFRGRTIAILARTALLVASVTATCVAIAVPLAWLTARTDLPLRRMWFVLAALPLVIPSFVGGLIVVASLGPKGILQGWLSAAFGIERLPEIYGFPGALLTLTLLSYPYVLLTVGGAINRIDPSLEEASRSLGKGPWNTFRKVTLPQLRPAIAGGGLLVALYTLSDFGAVSLLRFETFTWAIYLQYQSAFDRSVAASLSLVLVAVAFAILFIEVRTRGRSRYHTTEARPSRPPAFVKLGLWKWLASAFCGIIVFLGLIAPLAVLSYWLFRGVSAGEPMRFMWTAALNSLYVSALAGAVTVVAAVPLVLMTVRYPGRLSALMERSAYIGFALPGIVVALALVFFGVNFALPLYQTLGMLVLAYAILFMPTALGSIKSSLLRVNPRVEEAARSLGKGQLQVLASITFPLVRPGLLAGAALVFLVTMKELPATLLLSPIGFKTLATSIWSATSEAFFARAAAPALLLVLASSIPMAFLVLRGRKWVL